MEPVERLSNQGEDADKEIYGVRRLAAGGRRGRGARAALRPDRAVRPLRAGHSGKLVFPFRRYQIQKVWRGERPQEGRYREFTQADIDIVDSGALPFHYEVELPLVIADAFRKLPIPAFRIQVLLRQIPEGFYRGLGIEDITGCAPDRRQAGQDRSGQGDRPARANRGRVGGDGRSRCCDWRRSPAPTRRSRIRSGRSAYSTSSSTKASSGLTQIMTAANEHAPGLLLADLKIARGLDYYTGTVYETQLIGDEGLWIDLLRWPVRLARVRRQDDVPRCRDLDRCVADSCTGLSARGCWEASRSTPTAVLVALNAEQDGPGAMRTAAQLGARGIPLEVAPAAAKFGKQIRFADQRGIPFVLFSTEGQPGR